MRRDLSRDFVKEIKDMGKEPMKYVYICPVVKEGMDVLDPAIRMYSEQDIGAENISVVFAFEERFSEECIKNFKILEKRYGKKFREFYYEVHPAGIPGEVAGVKGANINWATRKFTKKVKERGESLHDYLLITCDSDMRPHKKYLSAITQKYYETENRDQTFYMTAVHTFNNNIWRVPPLNRVFGHTLTPVSYTHLTLPTIA